ncbi:MAG: NAD(P)H-hydrate dehydratase [Synergistaceae bacterium]|jgi:NAD(P)H-hydrate epimerase|nr:NAD(P)H-hydrate dehydratase [Synergistaceae bacterium]
MRIFYPSSTIREADRIAATELAMPVAVLMENAGRGAAEIIARRYPKSDNILVLCGPGSNGGDGFVAARHLALQGRHPTVISTVPPDSHSEDVRFAAMSAVNMGVPVILSAEREDEELAALADIADVVVDALLGTGSNGEPRGEVLRLVTAAGHARRTASLDIPSGIDPNTGEVGKNAVSAELTVTFLAEKKGMAVTPGALHCGDVETAHIGVPAGRLLSGTDVIKGYDRTDIASLAPRTPEDAHKSGRGGLLIIGGSMNFRGAPLLAALAALRAGCGLVLLAIPDLQVEEANALLPEAIFLPLPSKDGFIRGKAADRVIEPWYERCNAVVLGPGLGRSPECERLTAYIHKEWDVPLLMDADALYHLAALEKALYPSVSREDMLITPHAGEAAHLLGSTARTVTAKRLESGSELVIRFGATLLKGPRTLILSEGESRVILEGGPALAVPGSGDVLSGVIGAYMARGLSIMDAATLGALVHAEAGRRIARRDGVLAREIADSITTEEIF